jgi:signal recognition particle subunit SRP54
MEQETAERQAKRMIRGHFDFNDYALYLQQMEQMGGIAGIMEMMPGTQKFAEKNSDSLDESGTDNFIKKQTALIQAMTKKERTMAIPLNGSRKKRIALGAGSDVQNVNNLVKMHRQIGDMVKKISKLNPASLLMNGIKKKPTGQGAIPDLNSLKGFAGGEKAAKAMKNSPNFNVQNFLNSKKQWPL